MFSGSKYPKIILFNFEKGGTAGQHVQRPQAAMKQTPASREFVFKINPK